MTRTSAFRTFAFCLVPLALSTVGGAQQSPTQSPPTPIFRAGVDLIRLDVSVLDKNRKPVRGLTAADFLIREDGIAQTIDTFAAIDEPGAPTTPPVWIHKISPDVATNSLDSHRLFAIVMDDATIENNVDALANAKAIAHGVINKLSPTDVATIVFTRDNRNTQPFTNDPVRLHAAVDGFTGGFRGMGDVTNDPASDALPYANSVHVVEEVIHYLIGAPDRRKALVYIGQGVPVDHSAGQPILIGHGYNPNIRWREMQLDLIEKMKEIFLQAQRSNVNVYAMDACGLRASGGDPQSNTCQPGLEVDFLLTVAGNTGGRAVVNTGNFEPGIAQIFTENSSYYLLGYQQVKPKGQGQYARLDVQVKRPGVTVRARRINYSEPTEDERAAAEHRVPASPSERAIAGVLPDRDTPLRATVAPFGLPSPSGHVVLDQLAAVAIVLGVRERAPATRLNELVEFLTMAFTPEGDRRGAQTQTAQVAVRPAGVQDGPGAMASYEMLGRIDLAPGRYSLRLGTFNGTTRDSGSVFIDVDIPDFANAPLSLSGVLIESSSAPVSGSAKAVSDLVPIVPTTEREFPATATARAFLRAYYGSTSKPQPVTIATTISDAAGTVVSADHMTIEPSRFSEDRAADITFELPIARLKPGSYVLTFEAGTVGPAGSSRSTGSAGSPGSPALRRDVVFAVK